jgi:hypothetical protein
VSIWSPTVVLVRRVLRTLVLGLLLVLATTTATTAAVAGELLRLDDEVTDEVGAVADEEEALRSELVEIRERWGVQLFVLYTDTTGADPASAHVDRLAEANGLGGNDALLLVALDDRAYALWISDALAVDQDDHQRILLDTLEPRLADGDFAGAATATARHVGEAHAGTGTGTRGTGGAGGIGVGGVLLLTALAGIALLSVWQWANQRTGRRRAAEERDRRTGELAREANTMLVASDEAVREAQRELGFAEAQFREEDVQPFRAALEQAREELHTAFAVRQRLDDEEETPEEREQLLREIIAHTQRVDALLAEEHQRLDELREFEREVPAYFDRLSSSLEDLRGRMDAAHTALDELSRTAPRSTAPLDGNLAEAEKRMEAVEEARGRGGTALERSDIVSAAQAARDAQESLAEAIQLVEAVDHLNELAEEAQRSVDRELAAAEATVEAARDAVSGDDPAAVKEQLSEAEAELRRARSSTTDRSDIVEAYLAVTRTSALGNEVLAGVREAEEARDRARAAADAALRSAGSMYTTASDYIAARRRGIGREARTRLQESERHLDRARSLRDERPGQAVSEAKAAERLAEQAYRRARADFEDFDRLRGPFGRGPYGGRGGGTVIIGGFPIPMGGTRRGGGGWGGSGWGTRGGSGTSRGGGRSFGGSFGGGRGRSMGGRF